MQSCVQMMLVRSAIGVLVCAAVWWCGIAGHVAAAYWSSAWTYLFEPNTRVWYAAGLVSAACATCIVLRIAVSNGSPPRMLAGLFDRVPCRSLCVVAVLLSVLVVAASSWPLAAQLERLLHTTLEQAWAALEWITELLWTAWEWTTPLCNMGCAVYDVTVSLCTTLRDIAVYLLQTIGSELCLLGSFLLSVPTLACISVLSAVVGVWMWRAAKPAAAEPARAPMSPAASPVSNPRAATASDSRVAERIESLKECCVCLETFDGLTRTPRNLVLQRA